MSEDDYQVGMPGSPGAKLTKTVQSAFKRKGNAKMADQATEGTMEPTINEKTGFPFGKPPRAEPIYKTTQMDQVKTAEEESDEIQARKKEAAAKQRTDDSMARSKRQAQENQKAEDEGRAAKEVD